MKQNQASLSRIGFVSTYPPTSCGLATFTVALRESMAIGRGSDAGLGVVSVAGDRIDEPRPEVLHQLVNGDGSSLESAIEILNTHDVALLQHEYGIYGGPDGLEVLDLVANLDIPQAVTLHTVLSRPTLRQQKILERIIDVSDRAIVMSDTAAARLESRYDVDMGKVHVIPHGARTSLAGPAMHRGPRPVVLTWGLIGPGKGLETSIEAFATLRRLEPSPRYRILGRTHPKVQALQGDAYREGLIARAHALGLEDMVEFDGHYLDDESLTLAIRQADVILLPYESTEQVTSGVLVEALVAGKPVVATAFPHAVELLNTGAGIVVPHGDATAMAEALSVVLTDATKARRMGRAAGRIGSKFHWPVVAAAYESVVTELMTTPEPIAALDLARRRPAPVGGLAKVG